MKKIQNFSFNTFWQKTIGPTHTPAQGRRLSPTGSNFLKLIILNI